MSASKKTLFVVAGFLKNEKRECLLTQRPKGKAMEGLWEFPGGKIQKDELPEEALRRELKEELGIEVEPSSMKPITFASHAYEQFHLFMPLYEIGRWKGNPEGKEGQNLKWVEIEKLLDIHLLPADVPLAVFLKQLY